MTFFHLFWNIESVIYSVKSLWIVFNIMGIANGFNCSWIIIGVLLLGTGWENYIRRLKYTLFKAYQIYFRYTIQIFQYNVALLPICTHFYDKGCNRLFGILTSKLPNVIKVFTFHSPNSYFFGNYGDVWSIIEEGVDFRGAKCGP